MALASQLGHEVTEMNKPSLPPMERHILDTLIGEYDLSPDLVEKLLDLALNKYRFWGTQAQFVREVGETIEKALRQEDTAEEGS